MNVPVFMQPFGGAHFSYWPVFIRQAESTSPAFRAPWNLTPFTWRNHRPLTFNIHGFTSVCYPLAMTNIAMENGP